MSNEYKCYGTGCGKPLTENAHRESIEKYSIALCMSCQKLADEKLNKKTGFGNELLDEVNEYAKKTNEEINKTKEQLEAQKATADKVFPGVKIEEEKKVVVLEGAKNIFNTLKSSELKLEKKGRFNYSSWAHVWEKVKELYPLATFKAYENNEGLPFFTNKTSGMVKVGVTIEGLEHVQWHPILNHMNKPVSLDQINTFDINTSIQRALVKAIALHGLGLYVYQGEDLPKEDS